MGMLDPNQVIGILHGSVGDMVFVRMRNGKVYVRHMPLRKAGFNSGQVMSQDQFKLALAYVKSIRQQLDKYAVYQAAARVRGKRACDLANADFRHLPAIHDVDLSAYKGAIGQAIRVEAVDDFEVIGVLLAIADSSGALLEQGAAVLDRISSRWVYLTQAAVPGGQTVAVHVTAVDRAANSVTRSLDHALPAAA